MKCLLAVFVVLFTQSAYGESGLKYWYSSLNSDFEYYTGTRTSNAKVNVHEFSLNDSSGAFSAALQTASNRMAAEAGAINDENRKIAKGESVGGPKVLSYSYENAAAQDGDTKIYSLRLGSTENAFSSETFSTDRKKDGMVTYVELAMIAAMTGDMITTNEFFALRYDILIGARFGGIKVNALNSLNSEDRYKDAAYFYLPATARFGFYFAHNISLKVEYGQDPITLVRNLSDSDKPKIPLDRYSGLALEYRVDVYGFGLQYEGYRGSAIMGAGKNVVNPVYEHEMIGLYAVLGM